MEASLNHLANNSCIMLAKGRRPSTEEGDTHPAEASILWTFSGARFGILSRE